MRISNRIAFLSNAFYSATQGVTFLVIATIFYVGGRELSLGRLSTGDFFVALMAIVFGSIQVCCCFQNAPRILHLQQKLSANISCSITGWRSCASPPPRFAAAVSRGRFQIDTAALPASNTTMFSSFSITGYQICRNQKLPQKITSSWWTLSLRSTRRIHPEPL